MDTDKNEYFEYLDELRESGETNMYGIAPYLQAEFPELTQNKAREIVQDWRNTKESDYVLRLGVCRRNW